MTFRLGMVVLVVATAASAADWDRYRPTTIKEVLEAHPDALAGGYMIEAADFPFRLTLAYDGRVRPIPEEKRKLISYWVKSMEKGAETLALFEQEMLFREAGAEYWLPVQSALVPFFQREVPPGGPVTLYVLWLGGANGQPVFIVNELD